MILLVGLASEVASGVVCGVETSDDCSGRGDLGASSFTIIPLI